MQPTYIVCRYRILLQIILAVLLPIFINLRGGRKPYIIDAVKSKAKPISGTSHTLTIYILVLMW
uniref:Uncharacterized protein n=1 Tax=Triticum urartu TaxID=4572 RepID=A0A8R7P6T8_TRIUA